MLCALLSGWTASQPAQCFAKCPFTCQSDWLSDQLCQSLDRLFNHFAKHCPRSVQAEMPCLYSRVLGIGHRLYPISPIPIRLYQLQQSSRDWCPIDWRTRVWLAMSVAQLRTILCHQWFRIQGFVLQSTMVRCAGRCLCVRPKRCQQPPTQRHCALSVFIRAPPPERLRDPLAE